MAMAILILKAGCVQDNFAKDITMILFLSILKIDKNEKKIIGAGIKSAAMVSLLSLMISSCAVTVKDRKLPPPKETIVIKP
jgi:hypothetical protein